MSAPGQCLRNCGPASPSGRDTPLPRTPGRVQPFQSRQRRGTPCHATLVGPSRPSTNTNTSIDSMALQSKQGAPLVRDKQRQSVPQPALSGEEVEKRALQACVAWWQQHPHGLQLPQRYSEAMLESAYARSGTITSDYAKTFYLGTKLMTPEKARAIWAIYVWCRRTDELVDGPNAAHITPAALDRWEDRLECLFAGRPYDILDAALTDTVSKFPVCIQPFRDMIDGMRMDLVKPRYTTFSELYEYCYKVAGTVGLMTTPVMGIDPAYKGPLEGVFRAALALGTANQLTNILRDVGEDASERNRIYVPLQELDRFAIRESEVMHGMFNASDGVVEDRWVRFMKFQISRARAYFADAEAGVDYLDSDARWPVWSALILYRQILDSIEKNGYNNFTKRAYVAKWRKYLSLPLAYGRASIPQGLRKHVAEHKVAAPALEPQEIKS